MSLLDNKDKNIFLVFGKLCSGKGTFCQRYTERGYTHIATSDVVKRVSGAQTRSGLHNTKHLDMAIADELISLIRNNERIIIDGIRQLSIVERILQEFGKENVTLFWLEVPVEELKRRYHSRADVKDDQDFEDAITRDDQLGLGELEQQLKKRKELLVVDYYYDGERDKSAY